LYENQIETLCEKFIVLPVVVHTTEDYDS